MRSLSWTFIGAVLGLEALIAVFMLFHLGGSAWRFAQLAGSIIGGMIALISINIAYRDRESTEPLISRERLAWTLVGCGLIAWGLGESIWRYYMFTNQNPFPSYADIGYASLPPLIFAGMLLQPTSGTARKRLFLLLDSLISMASMLAIGWYLLLGDLALHSTVENPLAKFLGLYYPTTDVALLSCVVIMLLRGQGRLYQATARRVALIVVGIGLCFFVISDFTFNVLQNAGIYVEGTWVDLGWPLGLITIGLAAYLRRFIPLTPAVLVVLFGVLLLNIFSPDAGQRDIRPILLIATIAVVGLVIVRQILTLLDNARLTRRQADALERLEIVNRRVEDQARIIAERNVALERGVAELKDVQARLANGNLRARARLTGGELLPLAISLNLLADRLMHVEQADAYLQRLTQALAELGIALDRYRFGGPLIIPPACNDFPEVNRLLLAMGLKEKVDTFRPRHSVPTTEPTTQPVQGPNSRNF